MDRTDALEIIGNGHGIIAPEDAEDACKALGVPFDRAKLVQRWKSDASPANFKGLTMAKGYENSEGVYTLTLSYFVAGALGLGKPGASMIGRGSQARLNSEAVATKLGFAVA